MKFLIINGKLARMSNGDFITVPDNYNNEPLTINGKLLTVGGAIVGKNFTGEVQLATPQNVTADGTTVSWDTVENATSYEVIEGGNNVLGTYTPPTTVALSLTEANIDYRNYLKIYDGNIDSGSGTLLYQKNGTSGNAVSPQDLTITTGVLSIRGSGDSVAITVLSTSGDVKLQSAPDLQAIFNVSGQCAISLRINYSV